MSASGWLAPLAEHPFGPALAPIAQSAADASPPHANDQQKAGQAPTTAAAAAAAAMTTKAASKSAAKPKVSPPRVEEPVGGEPLTREEMQIQAQMRRFQQMEEAKKKKEKLQALKREREEADPCKCGFARERSALPKPLAPGGPRCLRCTPIPPPAPLRAAATLREAPLFTPAEEEFADPMRYIKSITPFFYQYGICRIQPPPSFRPPVYFRRHNEVAFGAEGEAGGAEAEAGGAGGGSGGASGLVAPGEAVHGPQQAAGNGGQPRRRRRRWRDDGRVSSRKGRSRERDRWRRRRDHGRDPAAKGAAAAAAAAAARRVVGGDGQRRGHDGRDSACQDGPGGRDCDRGGRGRGRWRRRGPRRRRRRRRRGRRPRRQAAPGRGGLHADCGHGHLRLAAAVDQAPPPRPAGGGRRGERGRRPAADPAAGGDAPSGGGRPAGFICAFTPQYARYSLRQFKELDLRFRRDVFPDATDEAPPPAEEVEQWFWHGFASEGDGKVLYCSDLDGTAFPHAGKYGEHPWSPARLAEAERSLLRFVEYAIPGVNTPMLYFGMLFSMFCWHVEDHYMYSTSYLHEGSHKTWYGVSSLHADAFEGAFSDHLAAGVAHDPELFVKKASMVPPSTLLERGVPVCRAVQEPGQFVVTLPQAYHAGFSHGFTSAEAVNFMSDEWLPYAKAAAERYRRLGKEPVIDLDHILVLASNADYCPPCTPSSPRASPRSSTAAARCGAGGAGVALEEATLTAEERRHAMGRSPPCATCGRICHFGFVTRRAAARAAARRDRRRRAKRGWRGGGGGGFGDEEGQGGGGGAAAADDDDARRRRRRPRRRRPRGVGPPVGGGVGGRRPRGGVPEPRR